MTDRESRKRRAAVAAVRALAPAPQHLPALIAGLKDAAEALDALAAGLEPDRVSVVVGALALEALAWTAPGCDILDAAAGLACIATGGELDLDDAGRRRARHLAAAVRALMGPADLPATSRASHYS
jgi:hypothetical protein